MSLAKHTAFLVAFLVLSGHAQAQFKGVAEPMPAVTAAPMAMPAPVTQSWGCDGPFHFSPERCDRNSRRRTRCCP